MAHTMMALVQTIFLITIPISTILTNLAVLMPYWWSSDTFQVGLWRARSLSSSWITMAPEINTSEGRLLFVLQILSIISVVLTDISCFVWLISVIRQTYYTSFKSLLFLLLLITVTYFCLSTVTFFVWYTTKTMSNPVDLSYSFYLTLIIILLHTISLISITMNIAKYRTNHHTIQPYRLNQKISLAFNEPIV